MALPDALPTAHFGSVLAREINQPKTREINLPIFSLAGPALPRYRPSLQTKRWIGSYSAPALVALNLGIAAPRDKCADIVPKPQLSNDLKSFD
jgi:hypothetical protein